MIKIILKHFIYEKCINLIFYKISNNFSNPVRKHRIRSVKCPVCDITFHVELPPMREVMTVGWICECNRCGNPFDIIESEGMTYIV